MNRLRVFLTVNFPSLVCFPLTQGQLFVNDANSLRATCVANLPSNTAFVFFVLYFPPDGSFAFGWTNLPIFPYGSWVLCHVSGGPPQCGLHQCLLTLCPRIS